MKLGDQGEAFFVEECDDENAVPVSLITSPLPSRPSTPTENGASDDKLWVFLIAIRATTFFRKLVHVLRAVFFLSPLKIFDRAINVI